MAFHPNLTASVGSTPLLWLLHLTAGLPATVALKAEFLNPLGSIKDRTVIAMIEAAEAAGRLGQGPHKIQGTGAGFIPADLRFDLVDAVIHIANEDAILTAQRLARAEGILAGISTGANVWAAIELTKRKEFAV
jgi:cysteine synthase